MKPSEWINKNAERLQALSPKMSRNEEAFFGLMTEIESVKEYLDRNIDQRVCEIDDRLTKLEQKNTPNIKTGDGKNIIGL